MPTDTSHIYPDGVRICPRGLVGWKTVLDHANGVMSRQFHILGLGLPIGQRVPYSKVVRLKLVSGALGVSRPGSRGARTQLRVPLPGLGIAGSRRRMTDKGADFYLMVTVEEGDTFKIGPIDSGDIAKEIEQQFRRRLGLPQDF